MNIRKKTTIFFYYTRTITLCKILSNRTNKRQNKTHRKTENIKTKTIQRNQNKTYNPANQYLNRTFYSSAHTILLHKILHFLWKKNYFSQQRFQIYNFVYLCTKSSYAPAVPCPTNCTSV